MATLCTRAASKFCRLDLKIKYFKLSGVTTDAKLRESEYSEEPQYPPTFDPSLEGRKLKQRLEWYESIRNLPTVDQKLCAILDNYPKRVKATVINPDNVSYNRLPFIQYCTKTHLVHGLPQDYHRNVDDIFQRVREPLLETVKLEHIYRGKSTEEFTMSRKTKQEKADIKNLLNEIMFLITSAVGCENQNIANAEISENPRCDSFWWHGDYYHKDGKDEPQEIPFQFTWRPTLQMRLPKPLPHVLERNDPLCQSDEIPNFPFHPKVHNCAYERRFLTSVPGFWNGNTSEFPFLSMDDLSFLHNYRHVCGNDIQDQNEAIIARAILGSFGWLMGIANNLGFTPFDELTYPITTQTALTNGKEWWFFIYQMNTIALMKDTNPHTHRNIIWSSGPLNLYETIEDGVLKGVDDNVIKTLVQFLVKKPVSEVNYNLKPYLNEDVDVEQPEYEYERITVRGKLRRYFDNRPDPKRHLYEIPTWHHIYKRNKLANPSPMVKLF